MKEEKSWYDAQVELAKKIQAVVTSGDYPLPIVLSTFQMLMFEWELQSYVQSGVAQQKAQTGKIETNIDPNIMNQINKTKH